MLNNDYVYCPIDQAWMHRDGKGGYVCHECLKRQAEEARRQRDALREAFRQCGS